MKTITSKQISWENRKWWIIDAEWKTLWRIATTIAVILRWKNKVDYVPHLDNWDYVIVLNCDKFKVTWKKLEDKIYYRHTGFLGWLKEISLWKLLDKKPTRPLELAVSWMLPKNKLRDWMISRLKMFSGAEHTFAAQKPEIIK